MLDDTSVGNTVTGMSTPRHLRPFLVLIALLTLAPACSSESVSETSPAPLDGRPESPLPPKLQELGPGGWTIFYTSRTPFPCGPDLVDLCSSLEVAPFSSEVERAWAHAENTDADVPRAERSAIGTGWANTIAIIEQGNTDPNLSAAAYAAAYEQNGYDDWYLPSRDEVHELTITRELIGGFTMETYWTSTERDGGRVWYQNFLNGFQFLDGKSTVYIVRPIRAF